MSETAKAWTPPPALKARYGALLDHHALQQVNRLFLISMRQQYLYCPVSKVANSSIKALLFRAEVASLGLQLPTGEHAYQKVHDPLFGPLILPYQLPNGPLHAALYGDHYFRFVAVRHPANRLLSCYLDRVRDHASAASRKVREGLGVERAEDISFSEFVSFVAGQDALTMNPHWRPTYHEAAFDLISYDMVLRFETLGADLAALFERLFPKVAHKLDVTTNLSPSITRASTRLEEFVTPEIAKKIELIYAKDFETFGY